MANLEVPDDGVAVVGVGYVGGRVLEALAEDRCIGINRSPVTGTRPVVRHDLDAGGALPVSLPERYRVLYTVAPSDESDSDFRLERLLAGLDPAPTAFVYISTTGVYGDRGGALVDESSKTSAMTGRALRRVAAERALQAWAADENVRLCILRTPGIYGPGRLGVARLRGGSPMLCEPDANPGNRIHVDDLVTCCMAALTDADASGIFNVGDGDFRTATWFAQEVARQSGLPLPAEISRAQAEKTFSPQRMSFLAESRRVDTTRMQQKLGVKPLYADPREGIRASLDEKKTLDQG